MDADLISASASPARVAAAVERLASAGRSLQHLDRAVAARTVKILESSRFAVDVLRNFDEAWEILRSGVFPRRPPGEPTDPLQIRKRYVLGLFAAMAADLTGTASFVETLGMISTAADEALEAALTLATSEMHDRFGVPAAACDRSGHGFAVIALGKLGGRELNFSSDIDPVFVCLSDGETTGGSRGKLADVEWYRRVAERLIDILSSRVISPFAIRIDMRLRPEGKSGPLIRTLESTAAYYESEGAAWERQAWLRARVAAGDRALGEELIATLRPFIYRRYLDRDSIYQIESIKARIESQASEHGRRHVKLSVGGIREIEFIVQLLQLAAGGRCEAIRTPSTLEALDRLVEHNYLLDEDRSFLRESYLFLRTIEHRLQYVDARQTHLLPEAADEMNVLARGMDFRNGEALWERYMEVTTEVRRFYERRFAGAKQVSITGIEEDVMRALDDAGDQRETVIGGELFSEAAAAELRRMSRGSIADPQTSSVRMLFLRSCAIWMPTMLALPQPERALSRLAHMVERYGAKASLYEIFASHPPVAELIVNIAALSDPLSAHLARDPSSIEALLSPGGVTGRRSRAALEERLAAMQAIAPDRARAAQVIRAEEMLRIGVRFLMGLADVRETGADLTTLAEVVIGETDFAVAALGRFGAADLGFSSDLDLVFVSPGSAAEAARMVQERIDFWGKCGLKIDSRLRPMGRTSPVVVDLPSLEGYFHGEAETWERVAWTRARVIAGPPELRRRLEAAMDRFLFERPFASAELEEMRGMRRRLRAEAGAEDIKRGVGGVMDLDFRAAARRLLRKSATVEPREAFAEWPALVRAQTYLRTLDASAWIVTGRTWRGDEGAEERRRIGAVLARHKARIEDLEDQRVVVAEQGIERLRDDEI